MFRGKEKSPSLRAIKNTFIAKEIEVQGNFNGTGAVQVEGILHGDISVTSVVIGQYGTINGTITATNVIVNGKLNGSIFCDKLEVMPNGKISNDIKVNKLVVAGQVDGIIESSDKIIVEHTGNVNATTMKSKNILLNGRFQGQLIASELLEIGSTGSVEGEITVKNIKTHEGGKLRGSMHIYFEETTTEDSLD